MNLQILSAEIVRRVQHSPDSARNLAETVAGLIRVEQKRDAYQEYERANRAEVVEIPNLNQMRRSYDRDFGQ